MLNFIKTTDNTTLTGLAIVALLILPALIQVCIHLLDPATVIHM